MEIWKYKLLVNYISLNKFYTLLFAKCLFDICFCYVTECRTFYWNSKYGHQKRDDAGNNLHHGYHVTRYGIWSFIQTTVLMTAHVHLKIDNNLSKICWDWKVLTRHLIQGQSKFFTLNKSRQVRLRCNCIICTCRWILHKESPFLAGLDKVCVFFTVYI